jgi:hypothetical protein
MRILHVLLLAFITPVVFYSCKKSSTSNTSGAGSTTSNWTLDGAKYTATGTHFESPILISSDNVGNSVSVFFNARPTVAGDYTIRAISPSNNLECSIIASTTSDDYYSTDAGQTAHVTISSSGKITISFSGVTTEPLSTSVEHILSGTIVEQ